MRSVFGLSSVRRSPARPPQPPTSPSLNANSGHPGHRSGANRPNSSCVAGSGFNNLDDPGLYAVDIIRTPIPKGDSRTAVVDYVRQAASFARNTAGSFAQEYLSELAALGDEVPGVTNDIELTERV